MMKCDPNVRQILDVIAYGSFGEQLQAQIELASALRGNPIDDTDVDFAKSLLSQSPSDRDNDVLASCVLDLVASSNLTFDEFVDTFRLVVSKSNIEMSDLEGCSKYISDALPDDIMAWLRKRFGLAARLIGPLFYPELAASVRRALKTTR